MRRNLIYFVCSITITGVMLCLFLGFSNTSPTQAHLSADTGKQKWEYGAVVESYGMNDGVINPVVGYAKIVYFDLSGYRDDIIKVQGDVTGIQQSELYERARQKALAVAIAQLGSQGWEMVGESPYTKRFSSDEKERTGLYFKRSRP